MINRSLSWQYFEVSGSVFDVFVLPLFGADRTTTTSASRQTASMAKQPEPQESHSTRDWAPCRYRLLWLHMSKCTTCGRSFAGPKHFFPGDSSHSPSFTKACVAPARCSSKFPKRPTNPHLGGVTVNALEFTSREKCRIPSNVAAGTINRGLINPGFPSYSEKAFIKVTVTFSQTISDFPKHLRRGQHFWDRRYF